MNAPARTDALAVEGIDNAMERAVACLDADGTQRNVLDRMQTRADLYKFSIRKQFVDRTVMTAMPVKDFVAKLESAD